VATTLNIPKQATAKINIRDSVGATLLEDESLSKPEGMQITQQREPIYS